MAAGDGNFALACASEGAGVVASDLAPAMVERGGRRTGDEGYDVEWVRADVEELPFEDARFDCVGSVFGAVFAPRPEVMARELFRVVRPGNTVGLTAWTPDSFTGRAVRGGQALLAAAPRPARRRELWGDEDTARARLDGLAARIEIERRSIVWEGESPEAFVAGLERDAPLQVAARDALSPEQLEAMHARVPRDRAQPQRRRRPGAHRGRVPPDRGAQARVALTARLLLEYDGAGFAGWARQPGLRTVQGVLEEALETIARAAADGSPSRGAPTAACTPAGRWRATRASRWTAARLNGLLPDDLSVLALRARAGGVRRPARRALAHLPLPRARPRGAEPARALAGALVAAAARSRRCCDACAAALPGRHDFTAFTPTQTDHVRFERDVLRAEWVEEPDDVLAFWIEADTFMRHMVRILVGTMLAVAGGRQTPERLRPAAHRATALRGGRDGARRTASTSRACATDGRRLSSKAVKVLLTNDDGIDAIGLRVMREALLEVPEMELAVIAPDSNRSATARSITTRQPLWVEEVDFGDGGSGFATDGTPVDCVRFAGARPRGVRAGADRVRHQPRRQPRRRHHLLGHGGRRARRAWCSASPPSRPPSRPSTGGSTPGCRTTGSARTSSRSPRSWRAWSRRWREVPMPEGTLLNVNCPAGDVRGRARLQARQARLPRPHEARRGGGRAAAATGSTASSRATARRTARTSRRWPTAASRSRRCTST